MAAKRRELDYLNGVPELVILRLVSETPMHGYQIVKSIRQSSESALEFGEGSIYPILHRLEREKLLSTRKELVEGRQRVVYRTTSKGRRQLGASTERWRSVVDAVNLVLNGNPHGTRNLAPHVAD